MLLAKIVARNVAAHRRKNAVVFAVTASVSMVLFLFLCFSDGELDNIRSGVSSFFSPWEDITCETGESARLSEARKSNLEATVANTAAVTAEMSALPSVKEAFGRTWNTWGNLYWKGAKYLDFRFQPLDAQDSVLRTKYRILKGKDIASGETGSVLIHKAVTKTVPIEVGDAVTMVGNDFFGQVSTLTLRVGGVFEPVQDNPNLYNMVILSREDLASFNGYMPDESNALGIRLNKGANPKKALLELEAWAKEKGLDLRFWPVSGSDRKSDFEMIFGMIRLLIVAMVLITLLITSVGIMNVISTNLHERKREIGTYYCLGSEPPFLMAAYSLELAAVNLAASVAGILGGLAVRGAINLAGISSDDPGFQIVAGGSVFRLGLSASSVAWVVGGVLVITVLTALTTLGKALKVSPVVAVRETES